MASCLLHAPNEIQIWSLNRSVNQLKVNRMQGTKKAIIVRLNPDELPTLDTRILCRERSKKLPSRSSLALLPVELVLRSSGLLSIDQLRSIECRERNKKLLPRSSLALLPAELILSLDPSSEEDEFVHHI